ncbi:MAG TPA: glycoside hydrolase family 3 C-terminal domain-containing protein, partial [Candidatus Dormibacteraeota bacterium]|nr:glycoside hydrolase family 3 C-terminal domain-containing protein [Candidatus Dormibacteraeota bacterium]
EIDDKVSRLLLLAQRMRALNGSASPDGSGQIASSHSALIDPAVVRDVTARSFVLLRNEGLLPLWAGSAARVAVIGPNAIEPQMQGGGSVRVLPVKRPGIAESIGEALDAQVTVSQGCITSATVPAPAEGSVHDPVTGKNGVRLTIRTADGTVIHDAPFSKTDVTWWDGLPEGWSDRGSQIVLRARFKPDVDGPHEIGAAGVGHIRVVIDGSVAGEADHPQPQESVEALSRPQELRVTAGFRKGREVEVAVELTIGGQLPAMRMGIGPQLDDERLLDEAVQAAAAADVAVVVVGSADGTESEGYDRTTLALPGRQDELVRRVAAANPNTVVVVNSGMPVLMPWAEAVPAVIQAWLPGQAFGEALAEVLSGNGEPGGRLPISLPRLETDSPVMQATPESGALVYSEGLLVGYRGFDRKGIEPLFGFGHGLGYTEWDYASITPATTSLDPGRDLDLSVIVRNAGTRTGHEVVQVYLEGPDDDPRRPLRVLGGFTGIEAEAGESVAARLKVPARAFMRFDELAGGWVTQPGTYVLRAGRSSRDLRLSAEVVMR